MKVLGFLFNRYRLFGLVILAIGLGCAYKIWYEKTGAGSVQMALIVLTPFAVFFGSATVLYPPLNPWFDPPAPDHTELDDHTELNDHTELDEPAEPSTGIDAKPNPLLDERHIPLWVRRTRAILYGLSVLCSLATELWFLLAK